MKLMVDPYCRDLVNKHIILFPEMSIKQKIWFLQIEQIISCYLVFHEMWGSQSKYGIM